MADSVFMDAEDPWIAKAIESKGLFGNSDKNIT